MTDKRKKGCPNTECRMNYKKVKQSPAINFCPICGSRLNYICTKCFSPIEGSDYNDHICKACCEKEEAFRNHIVNNAGNYAKAGAAAAVTVGAAVVKAMLRDPKNELIKGGIEIAGRALFKKKD